jgi:hypothetical protein
MEVEMTVIEVLEYFDRQGTPTTKDKLSIAKTRLNKELTRIRSKVRIESSRYKSKLVYYKSEVADED